MPSRKECITHHHACDCREALYKELIDSITELLYKPSSGVLFWESGLIWRDEAHLDKTERLRNVLTLIKEGSHGKQ